MELTRELKEQKVKEIASLAVIVDFPTVIKTHLGEIDMLDMYASCVQNAGKDWIYKGHISQLTDSEFDQIFTAVQDFLSRTKKDTL